MLTDTFITMDHGSGGVKTSQLIEELMVPAFSNPQLCALGDGAILPPAGGNLAFSTDSFVIDPLEFPGGDIGHLCVCGTANDLAMCGARPMWLSLSMILEEGFPVETLKRIIASIARTASLEGITIATGDTKVVEKGKGDGIYINTAGIGLVEEPGLSPDRITPGDRVIISGTLGDHSTAIMVARNDLGICADLKSDCMPLYRLAKAAWTCGGVKVLRDATRGGLATTLNEFTENRSFGIILEQGALPIKPEVKTVCGLLGLDPLYCANEGKMVSIVSADKADEVLKAIKSVPGGENAAIIGTVTGDYAGKVILKNRLGAMRIMPKLTGAMLPRIC